MTKEKTPRPWEDAEARSSVSEPIDESALPVPPAEEPTVEGTPEVPPPAPPEEPKEPDDGKKTPEQWAKVVFPASDKGRQNNDLWKHGAAAALHQWATFEHNTGAPIRLTEDDYKAALEAATKVGKDGTPTPHAAALGTAEQKGG